MGEIMKIIESQDLEEVFVYLKEMRETLAPLEVRGLRLKVCFGIIVKSPDPVTSLEAAALLEGLIERHRQIEKARGLHP
jgi:hypothetical protein